MRLQDKRVEYGLSQSKLAEKAGVKMQVLQRYEIGFRKIDGASLETLCNLAIALECGISDIIEDDVLREKFRKAIEKESTLK